MLYPLATQRVFPGLAPLEALLEMQDFSPILDWLNPNRHFNKIPSWSVSHYSLRRAAKGPQTHVQHQSSKNLHALVLETFTHHLTCARSALNQ